jgi:fido (protein-threonine AMPylation protein)
MSMIPISARGGQILLLLSKGEIYSATKITELLGEASISTIKREMKILIASRYVISVGGGRSAGYQITPQGRLILPFDAHDYCRVEPDKRGGLSRFNFSIFHDLQTDIFSGSEEIVFNMATRQYKSRINNLSLVLHKKELERLVIELSWKSSRIEGNTYTLLDTERLILEGKEAEGHPKEEAIMILNHKEAFSFIHENSDYFKVLSRRNLEELHKILIKGLGVGTGLRNGVVGITGSTYRPLDNIHQITDSVNEMINLVNHTESAFAKAIITLLCISYIQPFEDGNKRTSRLMANAILMAHGLAPLSYRSVDEVAYREAMLVFYELNILSPFKKIFIEQYDFAARNYAVS